MSVNGISELGTYNRQFIFMNELTGEFIFQDTIKKPDDCIYIMHYYEQEIEKRTKEEILNDFIKDRVERNMVRAGLVKAREFHPELFI